MRESRVAWRSYPLYGACDGASPPPRAGAAHATIYPYGPFTAADGRTRGGTAGCAAHCTTSSTRRLRARPVSFALLATGASDATPRAAMRCGSIL